MPLETKLLDYELPEELIAQEPLAVRSDSRMMVLHRDSRKIEHRKFSDIIEYIETVDLAVVNDSRVFPARLFVHKKTGGRVEILFQRPVDGYETRWEALARPGRRLREGMELFHESSVTPCCVMETDRGGGLWFIRVKCGPLLPFLEKYGVTPLPPYVKNQISDPEKYQTVYAENAGSAAAPTAGLHFTDELIGRIEEKGARFSKVTLHIGLDTFRPVTVDNLEDHDMHTEYYYVPGETERAIEDTKGAGGRVIAVGTTSVRSLESMAAGQGDERNSEFSGAGGFTNLFIYNREQFRIVDAMLTNFHLPRTTLLAMVCAFAGREFLLSAYEEAIKLRYRFFSFGDCMLIL